MGLLADLAAGRLVLKAMAEPVLPAANLDGLTQPWWTPTLVRTAHTGRVVSDADHAAVVGIAIRPKARAFAAAPPTVTRPHPDTGQPNYLTDHPVTRLLRRPNPDMSWRILASHIIWQIDLYGHAPILVARGQTTGRPLELWPVPATTIEPVGTSRQLISGFRYMVDGEEYALNRGDCLWLRTEPDPTNPRLGWAPIRHVLTEVLTDEEASAFTASVMANSAIPSVMLIPDDPTYPVSEDDARRIASQWETKFGGRGRGEPLIVGPGRFRVERVSWSPKDLDLAALRRIPEERIAAAVGIPAVLAGLGAGLDRATYSNVDGLYRWFVRQVISDLWSILEEELTVQLREAGAPLNDDETVTFDRRNVIALSEDRNETAERVARLVQSGVMMVSEARNLVGLPTDPTQDEWLRPATLIEVPATPSSEGD